MALFTNKRDRKLPLLTQFYQLDVHGSQEEYDRAREDEDVLLAPEPDQFIYLFSEGFEDEAYSKPGTWSAQKERGFYDIRPDDGWDGNLQIIHECICTVMEAVAFEQIPNLYEPIPMTYIDENGKEIAYEKDPPILTLNRYLAIYSIPPHFALDDKRLVVHEKNKYLTDYENMIVAVFSELIAFTKTGKLFLFCQECSSVFQPVKSERRFCSYRCTARAGQRRRREMK